MADDIVVVTDTETAAVEIIESHVDVSAVEEVNSITLESAVTELTLSDETIDIQVVEDTPISLECVDSDTHHIEYQEGLIVYGTNHNSLPGLQGGTTDEYYHLTAAQLDKLNNITEDKNYVHSQNVASTEWGIVHNLGKFPSVSVVDSGGSEVVGEVLYLDINTIKLIFGAAFTGKAYLN